KPFSSFLSNSEEISCLLLLFLIYLHHLSFEFDTKFLDSIRSQLRRDLICCRIDTFLLRFDIELTMAAIKRSVHRKYDLDISALRTFYLYITETLLSRETVYVMWNLRCRLNVPT